MNSCERVRLDQTGLNCWTGSLLQVRVKNRHRSDRKQSTGAGWLGQTGDQPGEKPSRREADSSSPYHAQDCSPGLIITVYYQALVLPKAR
ncbi:hypothetical protein Ciccas_003674 [Cichlidogyrus casuarinus]|uniref:Uncharacterized protein n=1 Tax=Cichlidogyrus casuarinus TaxID=1844966 RepID=A0ABD2QDN6_9PLAT